MNTIRKFRYFLLVMVRLSLVLALLPPAVAGQLRIDGISPSAADRSNVTPVTIEGDGFQAGVQGALCAGSPHLLGQTEFRQINVKRIALDGTRAYAIGDAPNLYVVEVSDPARPHLAQSIPTDSRALFLEDVVSGGRYVYVTAASHTDESGSLQVFDTLQPDLAGPVASLALTSPFGVERAGDYLYILVGPEPNEQDVALQVVDIHDPLQPLSRGRVTLSGALDRGYVAVADGFSYTVVDGNLYVVDIGNPDQPVSVATLALGGRAYDIVAARGHVYVATGSGLWVVDVSVPARPQVVANLDQTLPEGPKPGELVPRPPFAVALNGDRAYVGYAGMLRIVDMADSARPQVLYDAPTPTPGTVAGIAAAHGLAYLAAGDVQIIDVSVEANAAMLGQTGLKTGAYDLDVAGGFAYVGSQEGLHVVDVSDVQRPRLVETPYSGDRYARRVVVADGYAYVGNEGDSIPGRPFQGLGVFDLAQPEAPQPIGRIETGGALFAILDGYAYVAYGGGTGNSLQVIDLSDPGKPVSVGFLGGIGGAAALPVEDVTAAGDYTYLASKDSLQVVDVSIPSASRLVGWLGYPSLESVQGIEVRGSYAYLLGNRDLLVVDVRNPLAPLLAGSLRLPATAPNRPALALDVAGDYAYVAVSGLGLVVVRIDNPAAPRQIGISAYATGRNHGLPGGLRVVDGRVFGLTSAPGLAILRGFSPTLRSLWSSESVLRAEAVAWLPGGVYDLVLTNPAGTPAYLSHAFEVYGIEGVDSDGDGIYDRVEALYPFLDPRNPADAAEDEDGDGLSNLVEIGFAWDPAEPTDPRRADLSLSARTPAAGGAVGADFTVRYGIRNSGPDAAEDGLFALDLDPSLELVAVESDAGVCDASEGSLRCEWAKLGDSETTAVTVVLRPVQVGRVRLQAHVGARTVDNDQSDNHAETTVPIHSASPYAPAVGQRPRAIAAADGTVYTVFINGGGEVVVLHDDNGHRNWRAEVLPEVAASIAVEVSPDLWIDPKDGLLKVAVASAEGLLLYSRAGGGQWQWQNLTALTGTGATPVVGGLSHYLTPDLARDYDGNLLLKPNGEPIYPLPERDRNNAHIAGFDPAGDLVLYHQVREQDYGPTAWSYLNLTRDQLGPGFQNPPAWRGGPVGYATPWNGWSLAGVVGNGSLRVVWTAPDRNGIWSSTDISAGAPDAIPSAYVNWGLNLVTTDANETPQITWWSAEHGYRWAVTSFGRDLEAPPFRPTSLTGFTSPNEPASYVAGVTRQRELVLYYWTPETYWCSPDGRRCGEWISEYPAASIPGAEVPADALVGLVGKDGALSILGIAAGGDLLRYLREADGTWQVQNATRGAMARTEVGDNG